MPAGHVNIETRFRAEHQGDVQRIGDNGHVVPAKKIGRDLGGRRTGIENNRFTVGDQGGGGAADALFCFLVFLVLQGHRADLVWHRLQIGTAMFTHDMTLGFEFFQVLTHGDFGNVEGLCKDTDADAAFFPQPFQHPEATRLAEQPAILLRFVHE